MKTVISGRLEALLMAQALLIFWFIMAMSLRHRASFLRGSQCDSVSKIHPNGFCISFLGLLGKFEQGYDEHNGGVHVGSRSSTSQDVVPVNALWLLWSRRGYQSGAKKYHEGRSLRYSHRKEMA